MNASVRDQFCTNSDKEIDRDLVEFVQKLVTLVNSLTVFEKWIIRFRGEINRSAKTESRVIETRDRLHLRREEKTLM